MTDANIERQSALDTPYTRLMGNHLWYHDSPSYTLLGFLFDLEHHSDGRFTWRIPFTMVTLL